MPKISTSSEGIRNQRNAASMLVQGVVRIRSTPKDSESVTLRNRSPAVRAPCSVIITLPARVTKGDPGVIKRAGMAITAVKMGMKRKTRFRKKPRGTLDRKLRARIKANIIASGQKLRARPTMTIKSTKVTTLTLGSSL